jgi:3-dehydroquinate synthase
MKAAEVDLGERSYPIYVGAGLAGELGRALEELVPGITMCVVVTSPMINGLFGGHVIEGLRNLETSISLVPDGEVAKTWDNVNSLIGKLLDHGLDRKGVVLALGGGAIGDLAGFTASIYLRGVRLVQVPTTFLGMVDSSIGGKTAVNHPRGKNLIGSFHQPSLVIADPSLLRTLPDREILSGLAEVVKYGVIADRDLFNYLENNRERLLAKDMDALSHIVRRSSYIKAGYVERDELDIIGIRAALNYGHTLGHAIERIKSPEVRHGEGVSIGMEFATRIAVKRGLMNPRDADRQRKLLRELGLPLDWSDIPPEEILEVMRRDKKTERGHIKFVLPRGLGVDPTVEAVGDALIVETLEEPPCP